MLYQRPVSTLPAIFGSPKIPCSPIWVLPTAYVPDPLLAVFLGLELDLESVDASHLARLYLEDTIAPVAVGNLGKFEGVFLPGLA